MKPALVVDIETAGTPFDEGSLLTLSWQEVGEPHAHVARGADVPADVWDMIADPDRPFVSHTKYDARFLRLMGRVVTGPFHDTQVMAWVLNENQQLSLEALDRRYCHVQMDKRLKVRDGQVFFVCDDESVVPIADAPLDQLYAYNVRDVEATTELYLTLYERLHDTDWFTYWSRRIPFTEALLDMECAGLPINLEDSERLHEELELEHAEMMADLHTAGGLPVEFNLNSGQQMASFLFSKVFELAVSLEYSVDTVACIKSCFDGEHEDCGFEAEDGWPGDWHVVELLPPGFTIERVGRTQVHGRYTLKGLGLPPGKPAPKCEKGECDCARGKHKPSTSGPALKVNLAAARNEWVQDFLAFRKVDKALTTYLRKFPVVAHEGRIYARFNQTGTKTGRLSSSEPNLQNIPAHGDLGDRIRGLFQAPEGRVLVVGDYSQLEPRLMASFSEDPLLLDVYRNDRDIYLTTAEGIFGGVYDKDSTERGIAKTLVLAMGYGAGARKVAEILTVNGFPTDVETAKGYLLELQDLYATFFEWREQVITRVKKVGYVKTLGGRHRRLKAAFVDRRNFKAVGYGERQGVNAVVQGTAGDIVETGMVSTREVFPDLAQLAQVHDEVVSEAERALMGDTAFLLAYRELMETAHGFDLNVPLKFEPVFADSWADKGHGILELPDGYNEESVDYEEDR